MHFLLRRTANAEVLKYQNGITKIMLPVFLSINFLFAHLKLKRHPALSFEEMVHSINANFLTTIISIFPFTILIAISREFSSGYTAKLLSNSRSRNQYFYGKLLLATILSAVCSIVYVLSVCLAAILFGKEINVGLWANAVACFICSWFVNYCVVCLSLIFRSWAYVIICYYLYNFLEFYALYRFQSEIPWLKYLPISFTMNLFTHELMFSGGQIIEGIAVLAFCVGLLYLLTRRIFHSADLF